VRLRLLRLAIGIALALAAVYAAFSRVDWGALRAALGEASAAWLFAALGSVLTTLAVVTVRWRLLLSDPSVPVESAPIAPLWSSVVIGQAVNIVFPLRFGEGARVGVTAQTLRRPMSTVVLAMAVERVLDVSAFGVAVLALVVAGRMPAVFDRALPGAMVLALATVVVVLAAVRMGPVALHRLSDVLGGTSRLARWIATQDEALRAGGTNLRGLRLVNAIILTAVILLSSASTNLFTFSAFHLPVPPVAALVLLAVLQLGTAIVSVPGNIGVFHYLTVFTLGVWHIPQPLALATAIVLHVVSLGPRVVLGAVAAAMTRKQEPST
jgi:uncharacterized protein (TIRG00374 family)